MRAIPGLLFAALMLAGCASDPAPSSPIIEASAPGDPTSQNETASPSAPASPPKPEDEPEPTKPAEPEPTPNSAPNANLTSDVAVGEGPTEVTFTLDGADGDGDNLTWSFDADGDGTADAEGNHTVLPLEIRFTFEEGVYISRLIVSDGQREASAEVMIEVDAPPPCKTVVNAELGTAVQGSNAAVGSKIVGIYIVAGTDWAPGIYQESNGIPGLQIVETCAHNPDSRSP
jgi:PKD repeat protein